MLFDLLTALLAGYLAFTNQVADRVQTWFPGHEPTAITSEGVETTEEPTALPSQYDSEESIPRILLDNLRYQGATVVESQAEQDAYTSNPEDALVNIYCTYTTESAVRTTTGTGFFVNPDGVILTNAHVAQFLLLEDVFETGETECIVRAGNPAAPRYKASLLYIPPAWVREHASVILDEAPIGTGERDYALLYARESVSPEPMPARFPALRPSTAELRYGAINSEITAAGYPVDPDNVFALETDLRPETATSSITDMFTFGSNLADLLALRGSAVGTHGSSGGPVLDQNDEVIGLITTRGDDSVDGPGSLRAITLSYIDRTITEETGFSFARNISGNIPYRAQIFSETLQPFLTAILAREL